MSLSESPPQRESNRGHWETFWKERHDVAEVYSNENRILRNLTTVLDIRGKRILEIGAGTGRDSFPLAREGALVYQLDYAYHSLFILKKLAQEGQVPTMILGGDTFQLPFKDETFDVVFHQGLLEHFRKPHAERLLRENIRVLKRGGLLLVDVPQRYHPYTLAKHLLIAFDKWFAGWERSFSLPELAGLMRRLGVTPVFSYGEWMVPSFFYRVFREMLKKVRVVLPLYPRLGPFTRVRAAVRSVLHRTGLPRFTGISIGVIGRK